MQNNLIKVLIDLGVDWPNLKRQIYPILSFSMPSLTTHLSQNHQIWTKDANQLGYVFIFILFHFFFGGWVGGGCGCVTSWSNKTQMQSI